MKKTERLIWIKNKKTAKARVLDWLNIILENHQLLQKITKQVGKQMFP